MATSGNVVADLLGQMIAQSSVTVGAAAVIRHCQRRRVDLVVLAEDAPGDIVRDIAKAASESGIRYVVFGNRESLGILSGSRRPAAAIALRVVDGRPILGLSSLVGRPPVAADCALWFQAKRFGALESGRKRATLRLGVRYPVSMRLPIVETESEMIRGVVTLREYGCLPWGSVRERPHILSAEHPSDLTELHGEMLTIYPSMTDNSWMTYYLFSYEVLL